MPSAGLLFLLLASSFLLVSARVALPTSELMEVNNEKRGGVTDFLLSNTAGAGAVVAGFVALAAAPGGAIAAAVIVLITTAVSIGHAIKKSIEQSETILKRLDSIKLDMVEYQGDTKWEIWANGAYRDIESKINTAWREFQTTLRSVWQAKDEGDAEKHRQHFREFYTTYQSTASDLFGLLNKEGVYTLTKFGDLLAEHVRCHENEILKFSDFVRGLMLKAHIMNLYYYRLKNLLNDVRIDEQANFLYDVALSMYKIRKFCISNSWVYVKKDVRTLIDKNKGRQQLAEDVRSFLEKNYNRYDWMVVAFKTKKSSHKKMKILNSHLLAEFTPVEEEDITVAVARQLKGTTAANDIRKKIAECFPQAVNCYNVAEKLRQCFPKDRPFTAVHAYTRQAHSSATPTETAETVEEEVSASPEGTASYIYKGDCNRLLSTISNKLPFEKSKFEVMIKSQEELAGVDPCSKMDCGNGKCVKTEDSALAVCECSIPFYGKHCEFDLRDYVKYVLKQSEQAAELKP